MTEANRDRSVGASMLHVQYVARIRKSLLKHVASGMFRSFTYVSPSDTSLYTRPPFLDHDAMAHEQPRHVSLEQHVTDSRSHRNDGGRVTPVSRSG